MRFFTYIAFLFVGFALFPAHYAQAEDSAIDVIIDEAVELEEEPTDEALDSEIEEVEDNKVLSLEEAKSLIESLPTYSDAARGTVSTDISSEYYDIYGRKLAFREGIRELRASIDERRAVFEAPRAEILKSYRDVKEKLYAAEMAAYNENEESDVSEEVVEEESFHIDEVEQDTITEDYAHEEDVGLTEKETPFDGTPDFDHSEL